MAFFTYCFTITVLTLFLWFVSPVSIPLAHDHMTFDPATYIYIYIYIYILYINIARGREPEIVTSYMNIILCLTLCGLLLLSYARS